MPVASSYKPAPRITTLGDGFFDEVSPARFPKHELRFRNQRWAERVGLGELDANEWTACFARFEPLPENLAKPLALRYHGHQFDVYNPHLGDGRGFLFAQILDGDSRLLDLGTKGSGTTPWSRGGDGRLTLKGGVREVLATEMLEALGVSTSKTWSLFETGEALMRGDEPSPTRSSVLVRLSHSHVRFGTFQRLAFEGDVARIDRLLTYTIAQYFPHLMKVELVADRATRFLEEVTARTAKLAASFMVAGFVHGVLNSDNMNVTGESFDYGPYRFLPKFDPDFTAAYFDHSGLYAFGQQPRAMFRNVLRLGEALRKLAPEIALGSVVSAFEPVMEEEIVTRLLARLGVASKPDIDGALASAVYAFFEDNDLGHDRFFFDLHGGFPRAARASGPHYAGPKWDALRSILELYSPARATLPAYFDGEAPCTLLIDEIESIWDAIAERDDWAPFNAKVASIRAMGAALT